MQLFAMIVEPTYKGEPRDARVSGDFIVSIK